MLPDGFAEKLAHIVGEENVSTHAEERYLYSMDQGTMAPAAPDAVVLPGSAHEVSGILKLATACQVPVVPMGGGLVLSGLSRALHGGICVDTKRMNKVLFVSEKSRHAVVEAGTSQGVLQRYLKKHHPALKHSIPDSPPIATIAGNVLIHGSGHLSALAGFHSDMTNGLEVVLPTGEIVRTGSCSVSDGWFSRAPLPDLAGLFMGWNGTTGIVTKVGLKLFPAHPCNDLGIFVCEDPELMPEVIYRMSGVQVAEDLTAWMTPKPEWAAGFCHMNVAYGARTPRELIIKRNLLRESVAEFIDAKVAGFLPLPPPQKRRFLETPSRDLVRFADVRKGGGFEYVGAILPVEAFAEAYRAGLSVAEQSHVSYSMGARVVGTGHSMMFFYAYAFNRADPDDVARAQKALEQTNEVALSLGGIPWKAEEPAQKRIIAHMRPETFALMNRVRACLDPAGIMNPGNWDDKK